MSAANERPIGDIAGAIAAMSGTQLRERFRHEAYCHNAMKGRRKKGAQVHPDFLEFRSFLSHMGPAPVQGATIDRINPADPEYAPGKVRWADKHTQANNRQDTMILHNPATGESFTASQLAKRQGVSLSTIHKRRDRGWTDAEIIAGAKSKAVSLAPPTVARPMKSMSFGDVLSRYRPTNEELDAFKGYLARRRGEGEANEAAQRFAQERAHFLQLRAEAAPGEGEPLPALYEECCLVDPEHFGRLPEDPDELTELRKRTDGHWARNWFEKYRKLPVRHDLLNEAQLAALRRIDPKWVAEQEASLASSSATKALL
jgi:hypothetical protein